MKTVIVGIGTLLISIFVCLSVQNVSTYQRYNQDLRFVCEELSATGCLYNDKAEYSEGRWVFNQAEANKAINAQIKSMLKLDDSLVPLSNSYWRDRIAYKVYYYDDSNTDYASTTFTDPDTGYTQVIVCPTVIVTINAGRGRFYFTFFNPGNAIRSAAHENRSY